MLNLLDFALQDSIMLTKKHFSIKALIFHND